MALLSAASLRIDIPSSISAKSFPASRADYSCNEGALNTGKLFVGNLPRQVSKELLKRHFEQCGDVKDVLLFRDPSDPSAFRNFGFVQFEAPESASQALESLDNSNLGASCIRVQLDDGRSKYRQQKQYWKVGSWAPEGARSPPDSREEGTSKWLNDDKRNEHEGEQERAWKDANARKRKEWFERREASREGFREVLEKEPNNLQRVESAFRKIEKPKKSDWALLLRYHSRRADKHRARAAFEAMRSTGIPATSQDYTSLAQAYIRSDDMRNALSLISDMEAEGVPLTPVTFSVVLSGCAHAGDLGAAQSWFARYLESGLPPNPYVYGAMLHAFCNAGRLADARLLMSSMEREGLEVNSVHLETLLHGYATAGEEEQCEAVLERMERSGFPRSTHVFTSLLKLHSQTGDVAQASRILASMSSLGLRPSRHNYSQLMTTHLRAGDHQGVVNTFRDMESSGLRADAIVFNTLLRSLVRSIKAVRKGDGGGDGMDLAAAAVPSEKDEASSGVDPALRLPVALPPPAPTAVQLDNSMIMDRALSLVDRMRREGVSPTEETFAALAEGFIRSGDFVAAERVVAGMGSEDDGFEGAGEYTYNVVIHAYAQGGHVDQANSALSRADSLGVSPSLQSLTSLMDAHARRGELPPALDIFRRIQRRQRSSSHSTTNGRNGGEGGGGGGGGGRGGADVAAYGALVKACCKAGRMAEAMAVVEEMERGAEEEGESASAVPPQPTLQIYNSLIDGWARRGDLWEAADLLGRMRSLGMSPDVRSYTSLINAACKAGDMQRAMDVFEEMQRVGVPPNVHTFTTLIHGWAWAAYPEKALQAYEEMKARQQAESTGGGERRVAESRTMEGQHGGNVTDFDGEHQGSEESQEAAAAGRTHRGQKVSQLLPDPAVFHALLSCLLSRAAVSRDSVLPGILSVAADMQAACYSVDAPTAGHWWKFLRRAERRGGQLTDAVRPLFPAGWVQPVDDEWVEEEEEEEWDGDEEEEDESDDEECEDVGVASEGGGNEVSGLDQHLGQEVRL